MLQLADLLTRFHSIFVRHQPSPIDWHAYRRAIQPDGAEGFQRPDYLSVSPARCATTWLFAELRLTQGLRVADVKETNYFSYGWLIRILIVLREPVERVWSHLLFDLMRDSCFHVPRSDIGSRPESVLLPLMTFYDSLCRYDVLARHWLDNHPRDRIHIEWFDSIAAAPDAALDNILGFLGVSDHPRVIRERVNALNSTAFPMPPRVAAYLHELYAYRMADLGELLRSRAGMEMPASSHRQMPPVALDPLAILKDFYGYDIYYHAGAYHRVPAGGVLSSAVVSANGFFEVLPFEGFHYESVLERLMYWHMVQHAKSLPASDVPHGVSSLVLQPV